MFLLSIFRKLRVEEANLLCITTLVGKPEYMAYFLSDYSFSTSVNDVVNIFKPK